MFLVFRMLSLASLLGSMNAAYTTPETPDDETKMGGEGFGGIMTAIGFIAFVVLAVVIVLAILSLTGQFESDHMDPVT